MTRDERTILNRYRDEESPVSLGSLAEDCKIDIFIRVLKQGEDGYLGYDYDKKKYFIAVSKHTSRGRQRFTIAHELGHFFYHRDGLEKKIKRGGRTQGEENLEILINREGFSETEREANIFAANLLMPKLHIRELFYKLKDADVKNDEIIEKLAETYDVSYAAIRERLNYLDLISN